MGYFIWIPHTPCTRFAARLSLSLSIHFKENYPKVGTSTVHMPCVQPGVQPGWWLYVARRGCGVVLNITLHMWLTCNKSFTGGAGFQIKLPKESWIFCLTSLGKIFSKTLSKPPNKVITMYSGNLWLWSGLLFW